MPASRTWLTTSEAAARLHVTAKTVTRWASTGPPRAPADPRRPPPLRPRADRRARQRPDLPALTHAVRSSERSRLCLDVLPG